MIGAVSGQAITLANSIIGVGILAMPFCFQQCGVVLSLLLLFVSGLMSRLASHFLLKSAIRTRRKNFEILAFHVFGNLGKFAVEIGIIGFLMGTCIAYFVVVGDLGPQIVAKIFNINQSDVLRTIVMIMVSLVCVLPLGLLKDVDSLSNVCAITIAFYFCFVMKVIAEAGDNLFKGDWMMKIQYWQPDGVLRCLPIFSMSLFCQTQIFEIYDTLPNPSLDKMNLVTKNAVIICSAVYALVGLFGYIAFCDDTISGNILTNLSQSLSSDAVKMGFVMSLAFSFPLIIFPCRASLHSLLYKKGHVAPHDFLVNMMPDLRFKCLTISIIGVSLIIGLMLPNIELVLGFIGSTIGVIICVIFPSTCFIYITLKNTNERMLAQVVLGFGIIIMVLGTYANLQAAEIDSINFKHEHDYNQLKQDLKLDAINDIIREGEKNSLDVEKPAPIENIVPNKIAEVPNKTINQIEIPDMNVVKNSLNVMANNSAKQSKDLSSSQVLSNDKNIPQTKSSKSGTPTDIEKEIEELKKKDLLETIKKHEEEQRKLMNEQLQILKEMKETKKEIENDSLLKKVDAKRVNNSIIVDRKKAVENIQKLAKMAIESLGVNPEDEKRGKAEKVELTTKKPAHKFQKNDFNDIQKVNLNKEKETAKKLDPVADSGKMSGKIKTIDQNTKPVVSAMPLVPVMQEKKPDTLEASAKIVKSGESPKDQLR